MVVEEEEQEEEQEQEEEEEEEEEEKKKEEKRNALLLVPHLFVPQHLTFETGSDASRAVDSAVDRSRRRLGRPRK